MRPPRLVHIALLLVALPPGVAVVAAGPVCAAEVELVQLGPQNWRRFVPRGKEVDAIRGDYVLRNAQIVAVIGNPIAGRHANMTVHDVAGAVIDLTRRDRQSDQLSAFYPGAARFPFRQAAVAAGVEEGVSYAALVCRAAADGGLPEVTLTYRLAADQAWLDVETDFHNPHEGPLEVELIDAARTDRTFAVGFDESLGLLWAHDSWWRQAYGLVAEEATIAPIAESMKRRRPFLHYLVAGENGQAAGENGQAAGENGQAAGENGQAAGENGQVAGKNRVRLEPGQRFALRRKLFPAADLVQLKAIAARLQGRELERLLVSVVDPKGPVAGAEVRFERDGEFYGSGRTEDDGKLERELPAGKIDVVVRALGRSENRLTLDPAHVTRNEAILDAPGYVTGRITDESDGPIACKVEFRGKGETATPDFGPDCREHSLKNLLYAPHGRFRQEIGPGEYDVVISHGPEYDAIFKKIAVERGKETRLAGKLIRSVDTSGWVSGEFHSHSSPSGDNTSSQYGRVLNLLCEHLEFAPCTEHNRVSSYARHLARLKADDRMATCPGIELTGTPLPINHQNAFPLIHRPHTQDGGGPRVHPDPVLQIERLVLWDDKSDKLVQTNHPNIVQMLGDRDLDGQPDGGFEKMFGFMDVIEVHPPGSIFTPPERGTRLRGRGNAIFHWLQLLNQGYRVPGVVNTDAHYNFHGSGWLRNYIRSSTDDPAQIDIMEMVHASERGQIVMTNGPFLEVSIEADAGDGEGAATGGGATATGGAAAATDSTRPAAAAGPGDDISLPGGKALLHVRVQCPNWLDVDRVQVFLNGRPTPELNFTRQQARDKFAAEVVKFDQRIPLELTEDTHVVVATIGEAFNLGGVMGPNHADVAPIAVSNPIFVDVDGNGFAPNHDLLGYPLPIPGGALPEKEKEERMKEGGKSGRMKDEG